MRRIGVRARSRPALPLRLTLAGNGSCVLLFSLSWLNDPNVAEMCEQDRRVILFD